MRLFEFRVTNDSLGHPIDNQDIFLSYKAQTVCERSKWPPGLKRKPFLSNDQQGCSSGSKKKSDCKEIFEEVILIPTGFVTPVNMFQMSLCSQD